MKNLPQVDTPITHHFSEGVYAREMFIPADTFVLGKLHKTRHLNIVLKGRCRVKVGGRQFDVVAPHTFESLPGEQKAVYTYEDTVWMNIHVTDETDIAKIEAKVVVRTQIGEDMPWLGE